MCICLCVCAAACAVASNIRGRLHNAYCKMIMALKYQGDCASLKVLLSIMFIKERKGINVYSFSCTHSSKSQSKLEVKEEDKSVDFFSLCLFPSAELHGCTTFSNVLLDA